MCGRLDMLDLINVKTKKLATLLTVSFLVTMVAPMIIATLFSIVYFSKELRNHAMQKMYSDGKIAHLLYQNALNDVQQLAETYAKRNDVGLLLSYPLGQAFQKDLQQHIQSDQIDMFTIIDNERKVIIRGHSPDFSGDTISEYPYIVKALSGQSCAASEIFSHERLRHEGFNFPTSLSKTTLSLIMMTASAPVYDRKQSEIIGAIVVRKIVDPKGGIIKSISQTLSMNTGLYQGTSYLGTILEANETIFHPIPVNRLKQSLIKNNPMIHSEFFQNGYITLCLPFENFYHQPVVIIAIQRTANPYINTQQLAVIIHIVILCLAIFLGLFFRTRIERRILVPVRQLQDGVKQIRNGDYNHRLFVKGIDEIETLASAFNEMTVELQDKKEFLTRTEKKYRGIFENAVEGIFQMTPDGRFLDVNPAMARILGYSSPDELLSEITDLAKQSFVQPDDLSEFKHILAEKLQIIDFETQLYQKSGQKIWCSISARAVFDIDGEVLIKGDLLYYEGTLLDITNRKERDRAERARNAAEFANKAKTDFLARMSHEIRTPMNAILGMAEMLQKSPLNHEQKRYVDLFSSSGELLLNIINDILDFSKIEAGQLAIETIEFDLIQILENIGKVLSFKAHEKGLELIIHIEPDVPRYVIGDPIRLQQILINLTGNAIKFTQIGEVILKVSLDENNLESFLFSVKDTGIGIDRSFHSTIFERFSQADTSITRHYGGTGLGLAISKKLVELMDGKMWFQSEKGEGTIFYFTLPLPFSDQSNDFKTRALQKFVGKNALIIEKRMSSAKALESRLKFWLIHVDCFDSAERALTHIDSIPATPIPDLIFINQRLTDSDPFELREHILERLSIRPLFIMIFSSDNDLIKKNDAKTKGFDAFMNKPIMTSELDKAIDISINKERSDNRKSLPQKHSLLDIHQSLKILVADDHLSNRKVIEMFLKDDPIQIDFAENGQLAVEKYHANEYDMIFMDMEMPVLNGLIATKTIRETEKRDNMSFSIPIIFLTAHALDEHRNQCFEAGGTACLTKPVKYQLLMETIQQYAPVHCFADNREKTIVESSDNQSIEKYDTFGLEIETDDFDDMPDFSDVDIENSVAELLPFFIESTQQDLHQINISFQENNFEEIRRIGHSLKGSSGAYGQDHIGKIGESIELAVDQDEKGLILQYIQDLENALHKIKENQ